MRVFLAQSWLEFGPTFSVRLLNRRFMVPAGAEANCFLAREGALYFRSLELLSGLNARFGAARSVPGTGSPGHAAIRRALKRGHLCGYAADRLADMIDIARREITTWPIEQPVAATPVLQRIATNQAGAHGRSGIGAVRRPVKERSEAVFSGHSPAAALVLGTWFLCLVAISDPASASQSRACTEGGRLLKLGFYAHFEPVSHSAGQDPDSAGFNHHRGYEADLLSALEAIEGANLSFSRRAVAAWDGIWLLPAGPRYDIVGGGITILDSRTRNAAGETAIVFTTGHIDFRQSLLVRVEDAERLARHRDLSGADRVGVLAGTTGEARLLEVTGIADGAGVLAAGTRVDTPDSTVVADGGTDYRIDAAGASPGLAGRRLLRPMSAELPAVVYYPDDTALIEALATGRIDAVARGEIGNRAETRAHGRTFAVTALDSRAETGGFALAAGDAALAACIDRHIHRLTDGGRIGFREWFDDPSVFMRRALEPATVER